MNVRPKLPDSWFYLASAKASTLRERIDDPHRFRFEPAEPAQLGKLLEAWEKAAAPGRPAHFAGRLKNDGLTAADLPFLLGPVTIAGEKNLPHWVPAFRELMDFLGSYDAGNLDRDMDGLFGAGKHPELPFIRLITPMVAFASERLKQQIAEKLQSVFTDQGCRQLNLQLGSRLAWFSSRCFFMEFRVFLSANQSPLARILNAADSAGTAGDELYRRFTGQLLASGYEAFFAEYSALARVMTLVISYWVSNSAELIHRLYADRGEIALRFAGGTDPGRITDYSGGISDAHDHGKGVAAITFESGLRLVYKPKNLELEQAWTDLIDWLNNAGLKPRMRGLDILQCEGYGWEGFVEAMPCRNEEEVADYYRRIGVLTGILYILNGNDCHQENLIAAGPHPVLVDLESVMHHDGKALTDEDEESAMFQAGLHFGRSVLRTGLLPVWINIREGSVFDISGIGGYGTDEAQQDQVKWQDINTDRMDLVATPATVRRDHNLPELDGEIRLPGEFVQEIEEGFLSLYNFILRRRDDVPLHLFAGRELRFILRATRVYGMVMKKLTDPAFMRSGLERSLQMELLCRPFIEEKGTNPFLALAVSEITQMEDTDIPIFRADSDKTDLRDSTGIIVPNLMQRPVTDDVHKKLSSLGQEDLAVQLKLIRASLFFREFNHEQPGAPAPEKGHSQTGITASPELFTAEALEIARILGRDAIRAGDGTCTWMTATIIPGSERFRLQTMGTALYDGLAGVSLFLSAIAAETHDREIGQLVSCSIHSLRQGLKNIAKAGPEILGPSIGMGSGLSSVLYGLLKTAAFLNDASLTEEAWRAGRLVSEEMISRDRSFDIIGGSAGCLLAFLALYRATGKAEALKKAIRCGNHLLENREEMQGGTCGWKTHHDILLTGFSHGQAGIAYALLRLYEATGEIRFRDTAQRAIAYEDILFLQEESNWPDLRSYSPENGEGPSCMATWCHGAPGIGMARLAARTILGNNQIRSDIAAAFETMRNLPLMTRDHLCCGNIGIADILLSYALQKGDTAALLLARQRALQAIERARATGGYTLFGNQGADLFSPGLFHGLAGIGYGLLRLARPEKYPSVLLFG